MSEIATKDQERKALATIKKIVEGLGPQSYIATAFEGCFQDAEENIENDFACSMAERYRDEHEKSVHNESIATEARKALNAETEKVASLEDELETTLKNAETLNHWLADQKTEAGNAQRRAEAAEQLVTELKAKLYDYMTGTTR